MSTTRDEIVAALAPLAPLGFDVIPYARNIDPPDKPTVMVRIDRVAPSKAAGALWEVTGALVIIAPQTDPGAGDEQLDGALFDTLYAMDTTNITKHLTWTEAVRGGYPAHDPTNPAYEVTITTHPQRES